MRWKKYLEYANSGSSLRLDKSGQPMMLNKNCLIINILNSEDGSASGIIRTYNACDPNNTDAFGLSIDMNYDDNILMAGSKGGGYYLAIKSSLAQSPVYTIFKCQLGFISGDEILFLLHEKTNSFFFFLILLTFNICEAQTFFRTADLFQNTDRRSGKLNIIQDLNVDTLISRYVLGKSEY